MKVLIDTHVLLWWAGDPSRLAPSALAVILNPANEILMSVVSVWEIVTKAQLGKLTLHKPLHEVIAEQRSNGLALLRIDLEHVLGVETLPMIHKDPFDRLLASQAVAEGATLITADPIFAGYPVRTVW